MKTQLHISKGGPRSVVAEPPLRTRQSASLHSERGMVLVMTLALLAVATLLVVAFAIVMRVENMASANYRYAIQARQTAEAGVADAILRLKANTTNITANSYHVTMPGYILARPMIAGYTNVLYSIGTGPTVDMNANRDIGGALALGTIQSRWITVSNRGVMFGRYCYWIDDEASKVNINAAQQRTSASASQLGQTTAAIDLRTLDDRISPTIAHNYAINCGFETTHSWPAAGYPAWPQGAGIPMVCTQQLFNMTAYSTDIKLTPWGTPCFNLNTNALQQGGTDIRPIVWLIATNYLNNPRLRTDWFGQTFTNKYGIDTHLQIAANIVDYIVPVGITHANGSRNADSSNAPGTDPGAPRFLGLRVTPYLNEVVVSNHVSTVRINPGTNETTFSCWASVELWNPWMGGGGDPSGTQVLLRNMPVLRITGNMLPPAIPTNTPFQFTISSLPNVPANNQYRVANYALLNNYRVRWLSSGAGPRYSLQWGSANNTRSVTGIYRNVASPPGYRIDYAIFPMGDGFGLRNVPNPGPPEIRWASSSCIDPRVKPVSTNWTARVNPTLRNQNGNVNFNMTIRSVTGDGDSSSHTTQNQSPGRMDSVGQLGYIHTGRPWRTLQLRPQPNAERTQGYVPDWAVLDLFTTSPTNVPGRININSRIRDNTGFLPAARQIRRVGRTMKDPLLYNTGIGGAMSNLHNRIWVNGYNVPSGQPGWSGFGTNCYTWVGQVCEVRGVADNTTLLKANRERGVRAIANLITTRSDTFTIWCWGQSIREIGTPNGVFGGADQILAEARLQTVVQRSTNNTYRIIYQRWVTP